MKYIFVGPSGYNVPEHFFDGWICLPPCKQTDIMKLVETVQPTHIALVDGLYMSVPAPWHKEILLALENNIQVYGLSSMGALRAVELQSFGMKGYGLVYEYIKKNEPIDDSIVAVVHDSEKSNSFKPLTYAKIEINFFYKSLKNASLLSDLHFQVLSKQLNEIYFQNLSKSKVLSELKSVGLYDGQALIDYYFVSIKQADLINFLTSGFLDITTTNHINQTPNFITSKTPYIYRQFAIDYDTPSSNGRIDENRLSFQMFAALSNSILHDKFCLMAHTALLLESLFVACNSHPQCTYLNSICNNLKHLNSTKIFSNKNNIAILTLNNYDYLSSTINNLFPHESLDQLTDEDFNSFINLHVHPTLTNNVGLCELITTNAARNMFTVNMKLSQILYTLYHYPHHYYEEFSLSLSPLSFDLEIKQTHALFFIRYFDRIKCLSLNFFHGSLIVSAMLQSDPGLSSAFQDFIIPTSSEIPYRLYLEEYQSNRMAYAVQHVRDLNSKRVLIIRPSTSLGSHFIDIKYLLRFALSYYDQ